MVKEKPPIGVMPENIHRSQRMEDLSRAIDRYVSGGFYGKDYNAWIIKWCDELCRLLEEVQ